MVYHKQSWAAREGALGDEAEGKYEEETEAGYERFGLNRPNLHMASLPALIRHSPDYLESKALVEVMGLGNDQLLKLKHEKWQALQTWDLIHPCELFVWDRKNKRTVRAGISEVRGWIMHETTTTDRFHDGPWYYAIKAQVIWGE